MISPSANFYMRSYFVLPSEVKGSGPKHIIQKEDVLKFVKENNLKIGQMKQMQASQTKPKEEKKKSEKK